MTPNLPVQSHCNHLWGLFRCSQPQLDDARAKGFRNGKPVSWEYFQLYCSGIMPMLLGIVDGGISMHVPLSFAVNCAL